VDALALGLSLGLGAGLAPGPLLVLVVRATLERGFAAGARVAAVPLLSDTPIVVLCVLVLRELPKEALAGLSLAGAVFVGGLAWDALRADAPEAAAGGADLRRAVLVNALSPHPWLFWTTVGGPLLVDAGQRSLGLAVAFLGGFYAMLVGAKVAVAALVEGGRRRGRLRLLPRAVAARVATIPMIERLGTTRVVSAVLLAAVAVALAADAAARLI
jgi:threonine/homoserine/homoserine lactone efflux protein